MLLYLCLTSVTPQPAQWDDGLSFLFAVERPASSVQILSGCQVRNLGWNRSWRMYLSKVFHAFFSLHIAGELPSYRRSVAKETLYERRNTLAGYLLSTSTNCQRKARLTLLCNQLFRHMDGEVMMRSVFINPERCIGCRQCEFACAMEHSQSKVAATALVEDPLPRTRIHVEPGPALNTSFPVRCHHCNPAPCGQVCPTGAITRETETGPGPGRHSQMHCLCDVRNGVPVRRRNLSRASQRNATAYCRDEVRRLR